VGALIWLYNKKINQSLQKKFAEQQKAIEQMLNDTKKHK
jgi:hypothetical protein